jgi:SAM-dependent methyltransferase
MPEDYFGERVAERYDERYAHFSDPALVDPIVAFLADLARDGAALELGIGTGRIALPLAQRGVPVHGIDLSEAMVARLRAKPGAEGIGVTIGDFATTNVEATFAVAYLVANTIMNLTTQDEQVACFRNAAAHLEPGGCFVIEVLVPGLQRLPPGETFQPFDVSPTHLGFDEYDVARQGVVSHHYWIAEGKVEVFSPPFRYVWPAELDLMARLAGMTLRERWSGWKREPFTSDSTKHVSVWEKPASPPGAGSRLRSTAGFSRAGREESPGSDQAGGRTTENLAEANSPLRPSSSRRSSIRRGSRGAPPPSVTGAIDTRTSSSSPTSAN